MKLSRKLKSCGSLLLPTVLSSLCGSYIGAATPAPDLGPQDKRCVALAGIEGLLLDDPDTKIVSARLRTDFRAEPQSGWSERSMPNHCELDGVLREWRTSGGEVYATRFRLRLPLSWNGRFLFQGGGGTNGVVRNALGPVQNGSPTALERGFAVVTTDGGHDNERNYNAARSGVMAFGHHYSARVDLAESSLNSVASAAKRIISIFYGSAPQFSYFMGCSNGGREGMIFAQRFPDQFDGIIASAPAISGPKAAIASVWRTQRYAQISADAGQRTAAGGPNLAQAFSDGDFKLVSDTVARVCDARDGLADGLVQDFEGCSNERIVPALRTMTCSGPKTASCLREAQVDGIISVMAGPRTAGGHEIYPDFPWDTGIRHEDWRSWHLGSEKGTSRDISLMVPGLAAVFMTPPTELSDRPEDLLRYALAFNVERDSLGIFSASPLFPRSSWDLFAAGSTNLQRFRQLGGKMIIAHGASDEVFSIRDTARWWREVDNAEAGKASNFVRLFNVPDAGHCFNGGTVDQFDALGAIEAWVESDIAPARIVARGAEDSKWPSRTRPLCPYPSIARFQNGNPELAESFACQ